MPRFHCADFYPAFPQESKSVNDEAEAKSAVFVTASHDVVKFATESVLCLEGGELMAINVQEVPILLTHEAYQ